MVTSLFNNPDVQSSPNLVHHVQKTARDQSVLGLLLTGETTRQSSSDIRRGIEMAVEVFPEVRKDAGRVTMKDGVLTDTLRYKTEMWWNFQDFINNFGASFFPLVFTEYKNQCMQREKKTRRRNSALTSEVNSTFSALEKSTRYKSVQFRIPANSCKNERGSRYLYFGPFLFYGLAYRERFLGGKITIPSRSDLTNIIEKMFHVAASKTPDSNKSFASSVLNQYVYAGIKKAALSPEFKEATDGTQEEHPQLWAGLANFLSSPVGKDNFPQLNAVFAEEDRARYYSISTAVSNAASNTDIQKKGWLPFCLHGKKRRYSVFCLFYILSELESHFDEIVQFWSQDCKEAGNEE